MHPGPTLSTRSLVPRIETHKSYEAFRLSSEMEGWPEQAISPYSRSIRVSSTAPEHHSLRTHFTSIRRISFALRLKADATLWLPRLGHWPWYRESTRTRFLSS